MSPQEFEQALHDAEVKLARLKALYEQWFQGIERLEPSVARKDLDRTLDMLKRNVPRNTALRFRTQQLWARYGTYGIYWGRISRQIEEGTYKRDIIRATRKRITAASRRAADQGYELDLDVDVDVDLDVGGEDLPDEKTDPGIVVTTPGKPSVPAAAAAPKPALSFDDGDLDAILGSLSGASSPPEAAARNRSARPLSPFAMGARPAAGAASATFGKPKDKPATAATPGPATPAAAAPLAPAPPIVPAVAPKPMPPTPAVAAAAPPRPAAALAPAAPAAPVVPKPAAPAVPRPATATPAVPVVKPPTPAVPVAKPPIPAVPRPAAAAAPLPRPAAPAAPVAPRPAAAAPSPPKDMDEGQMRAIYSRYVDARRQNNERTDVRYESLAESVQKMMPKLREKHAGKPIDFEVVVQNGKVGLKPKVGG